MLCQIDLAMTVQDNSAEEVIELALSIAERRWHVPKLLSTALIVAHGAEPACVLLYLSLLSKRLSLPASHEGEVRSLVRSTKGSEERGPMEGRKEEQERVLQTSRPPQLASCDGAESGMGRGVEQARKFGEIGLAKAVCPHTSFTTKGADRGGSGQVGMEGAGRPREGGGDSTSMSQGRMLHPRDLEVWRSAFFSCSLVSRRALGSPF